jgi:hypothetical protein
MRHIHLRALCCLVLIVTPLAEAQSILDGAFWRGLTKTQKNTYIGGYFVGYLAGTNDTKDALEVRLPKSKDVIDETSPALTVRHATNGAVADGVDKCYSDFRNRQLHVSVCIAWAIMGIKGESNAYREGFLEVMRKEQP